MGLLPLFSTAPPPPRSNYAPRGGPTKSIAQRLLKKSDFTQNLGKPGFLHKFVLEPI